MRRGLITVAIAALCLAPLHADLTIVQTMTMEGQLAGAMGGALPTMTMRIKGNKARTDVEIQGTTVSTIMDLTTKEVYILNSTEKTAELISAGSAGSTAPVLDALGKMDFEYKPTGQKRTIEGNECEEQTFVLKLNMADMAPEGSQMPAEAVEAMKGVQLIANGSIWIAKTGPGVAEFIAFQKAAADSNLLTAMMGGKPGGGKGLEKLAAAASSAPGLPYLSEITMTFEGTGPVVEMMKSMGPMKMIQKATSVKTDPLSDDLFKVPEGYKVEKK